MKTKTKKETTQESAYYLIFEQVHQAGTGNSSDISTEELDEIAQIRQIVSDLSDDRPIFMTST